MRSFAEAGGSTRAVTRMWASAVRSAVPLLAALFLFAVGCEDGGNPVDPSGSLPGAVEAAGELPDTAVVGTTLAGALRVRVTDADGGGVSGIPVAWRVVGGGGSLSADTTTTGGDGVASVDWTLGTAVGENAAAASVLGLTEVFFAIEAEAGAAAVIALSADTVAFAALEDAHELTADVADAYGNEIGEPAVAWTSTDGDVAVVDDAGTVTAAGAGAARIIAAAGTAADTVVVVVEQTPVGVAIEPAADTLDALGESVQLAAVARDANDHAIADAGVTWTSLDEAIATVDAQGNVVAVATGTARIVALAGGVADTATVLVRQLAPSVVIDPPAITLDALGASAALDAAVRDANGHPVAGAVVEWESLDEEIATVTVGAATTVTGHAVGEARIVASSAGIADTDTATIVVRQLPATVTLTPGTAALDALDDVVDFTVVVEDANGNAIPDPDVQWTSEDESVGALEVDAGGNTAQLVALANGTIDVVATAGDVADTATVEVRQLAATVTLEPAEHTLNALGDEVQLTAAVRDANGNDIPAAVIDWTTLDAAVANVDGDGTVTADAVGTVDIIAEVDEVADTTSITVRQVPASITPLAPADITLYQDSAVQFSVVVKDSNDVVIPDPVLTWTTGNDEVARVNVDGQEGLVLAAREGETTIAAATGVAGVQTSATVAVLGRIAFVRGPQGNREIFVMNEDGTGVTQLTFNAVDDSDPAWSPDGSQIVFSSGTLGNHEIFIMDADGGGVEQVTTNAFDDVRPSWSPDGSQIVFQSSRGVLDLYVIETDGTAEAQLTTTGDDDFGPVWSPNGSQIAFWSNRLFNNDVYITNAAGTSELRLTTDPALDVDPAWSPDGAQIVFASERDGDFEIFVINDDGTGLSAPLTSNGENDGEPVWSADGTRIVFWRGAPGNEEIYIMNADGSVQTNLTNDAASDTQPVWRPKP